MEPMCATASKEEYSLRVANLYLFSVEKKLESKKRAGFTVRLKPSECVKTNKSINRKIR